MTIRVTSQSTKIHLAAAAENSVPLGCTYRLERAFAAIYFEEDRTGRLAVLPKGAAVQAIGISRISECFEVKWKDRLYSVFQADLLGMWAIRMPLIRLKAARGCA